MFFSNLLDKDSLWCWQWPCVFSTEYYGWRTISWLSGKLFLWRWKSTWFMIPGPIVWSTAQCLIKWTSDANSQPFDAVEYTHDSNKDILYVWGQFVVLWHLPGRVRTLYLILNKEVLTLVSVSFALSLSCLVTRFLKCHHHNRVCSVVAKVLWVVLCMLLLGVLEVC